jgi:quercetin dioxygenase-like cupin family protein
MPSHRTTHRTACSTALAALLLAAGAACAQAPGGCNTPASQRTSDAGCYLSATQVLGTLPQEPLFWHLHVYPSRSAAAADKGLRGTVVESFDRVWLYTIAGADWNAAGGRRVARIGPLPIVAGRPYTARYMEAVFTPGMKAAIHRHPGPEAWYLVSGAQCLETPDGITVARMGEGAVVPEGPPMALSSVGPETRRSVLLVLHDTSRPWIAMESEWKPKGLCPK